MLLQLQQKACDIRSDIVRLVASAGCGHIGGDLSVTDALVALYYKHMNIFPSNQTDPMRDRFILSKGHSTEALYCVLADCGFFERQELFETYSRYQSRFIGHPNNKVPGVEMNSGSLGHGLSTAVGMALAGKRLGAGYRVYTIMGDGELAEGSVWEGAMAGSHFGLDNLTAFVDRNRLQISGSTETVMAQDSQEERWAAFGWHVQSVAGNEMQAVDEAIEAAKQYRGKPSMIILNTTKGCGVSFMENRAEWHHKVPNGEQMEQALAELKQTRGLLV